MRVENTSGIHPSGDRVLIKPQSVEHVTEGGIVIPDTVTKQHSMAQYVGTLVAVGPDAWVDHVITRSDGSWERHGFTRPFAKVGDRVFFAKYGGRVVTGKDGEEYRVMNDVDITAVVDEEVGYVGLQSRKPFIEQQ